MLTDDTYSLTHFGIRQTNALEKEVCLGQFACLESKKILHESDFDTVSHISSLLARKQDRQPFRHISYLFQFQRIPSGIEATTKCICNILQVVRMSFHYISIHKCHCVFPSVFFSSLFPDVFLNGLKKFLVMIVNVADGIKEKYASDIWEQDDKEYCD